MQQQFNKIKFTEKIKPTELNATLFMANCKDFYIKL